MNSSLRTAALACALTVVSISATNEHASASPPEILDTAVAGFRAAEAKLTRVTAAVSRKLNHPVMRRDFAEAQKAWILYREKEASWRAGLTSGGASAYNSDYLIFKTDLTEQRIKEISKLLDGEVGR